MSGLSRSDPIARDPVRGDTVKRQANTYRCVGRGVANSVRFARTTSSGMSLAGQKSLPCWVRLVEGAEVVARGPR